MIRAISMPMSPAYTQASRVMTAQQVNTPKSDAVTPVTNTQREGAFGMKALREKAQEVLFPVQDFFFPESVVSLNRIQNYLLGPTKEALATAKQDFEKMSPLQKVLSSLNPRSHKNRLKGTVRYFEKPPEDNVFNGTVYIPNLYVKGVEFGQYTDLGGMDLNGANFDGTDLPTARLPMSIRRSTFKGANLSDAELASGVITDSDFTGADLNGANLNEVVLERVNMQNANLKGSSLACSEITKGNFTGAAIDNETVFYKAKISETKGLPEELNTSSGAYWQFKNKLLRTWGIKY
jgi:hypothetical protein